jgi:hypothetical protein
MTSRQSTEEVLDRIGLHFFANRDKVGGRKRRFGMEAILEPEEAHFGCRLPFRVSCYVRCQSCGGTGEGWTLCLDCNGLGIVKGVRELTLEISPGTRDGERFKVGLGNLGLGHLFLDVRITVSNCGGKKGY